MILLRIRRKAHDGLLERIHWMPAPTVREELKLGEALRAMLKFNGLMEVWTVSVINKQQYFRRIASNELNPI